MKNYSEYYTYVVTCKWPLDIAEISMPGAFFSLRCEDNQREISRG